MRQAGLLQHRRKHCQRALTCCSCAPACSRTSLPVEAHSAEAYLEFDSKSGTPSAERSSGGTDLGGELSAEGKSLAEEGNTPAKTQVHCRWHRAEPPHQHQEPSKASAKSSPSLLSHPLSTSRLRSSPSPSRGLLYCRRRVRGWAGVGRDAVTKGRDCRHQIQAQGPVPGHHQALHPEP